MTEPEAVANGIEVPRGRGEEARRWLKERGLLAEDLRPRVTGSSLLLPLRTGERVVGSPFPSAPVRAEFAPLPRPGPRTYQDLVTLPQELKGLLPRSFDVIGDIVVIRLPPALDGVAAELGAALLSFVPGCRLVAQDRGVHGSFRTRELSPIAGHGDWRTTHQENGLRFRVDPSRVYFSPRLAREHGQVATLSMDGEYVLDLFCGLGPFCLTILKRQPRTTAHAVDNNPDAIALLEENARMLGVERRVLPILEDADSLLQRSGSYDRVIANLPHEGYKYASPVANVVRPGGHLHIYEVAPRTGVSRVQAVMERLSRPHGDWNLLDRHVVHGYSASEDLIALYFQRGR